MNATTDTTDVLADAWHSFRSAQNDPTGQSSTLGLFADRTRNKNEALVKQYENSVQAGAMGRGYLQDAYTGASELVKHPIRSVASTIPSLVGKWWDADNAAVESGERLLLAEDNFRKWKLKEQQQLSGLSND